MDISIIVAAAENNVIGREGDLPWHISDDLKRFKALTTGKPVIMGRATWDSLPKKPLPGRRNIVLTNNPDFKAEGAEVFLMMSQAFDAVRDAPEVFVIGGGQIYSQAMLFANKIYMTRVHQTIDGDTTFPAIPDTFKEIAREEHLDHDPPYSFLTYAQG